ncbi:hypothetical protein [Chamaesiphon sp. VAR_48_metabat_403]|uniref:hypothetical protein n=1 Tax=Chamaesiphon sp. VAR_48_metabat_403 TaxID=2964700 RepID=UPI00286DCB7C|nr:hypothetical protein [Chamaesiphon sp. VAR_48_metabat_403]
MKLHQLTIGLTVTFLLQLVAPSISPTGRISIDIQSANATQQTDGLWLKYLGGRKIVQFERYSSGNGGGGISSKKEFHFCTNGQFAYGSQGSFTANVPGASASGSGGNSITGTWKIIESNQSLAAIEFAGSTGEKQQYLLGFGQDGRLYNRAGDKLLTAPSDACR